MIANKTGMNSPYISPRNVETVLSSSLLQTSSTGIGEFGMNQAHRGYVAAFSMLAVKENLFPKLNLQ
jgi:hypothetical protein